MNTIIFIGLIIIFIVRNIIKFMSKQGETEKVLVPQETSQVWWADEVDDSIKPETHEKLKQVLLQEKQKTTHISHEQILEEPYIEEENNYNLSELPEARKAFIYSEIFNRKY